MKPSILQIVQFSDYSCSSKIAAVYFFSHQNSFYFHVETLPFMSDNHKDNLFFISEVNIPYKFLSYHKCVPFKNDFVYM